MPTLEPYVYKDENGNYYINGNKVSDFYYSPGDPIKQAFILNALIALGGNNKYSLLCDDDSQIYYIDVNDSIIYKCSDTSQMGILLTLYGSLVETVETTLSTTWQEHYKKYGYEKDPLSSLWTSITSKIGTYTGNTDERDLSSSYIAFMKLTFLRDEYRMDWLPDVSRDGSIWAIVYNDNEPQVIRRNCTLNSHFSFQSEEIANMFFTYFIDLIDEAKYCMGFEDVECNIVKKVSSDSSVAISDENGTDVTSSLNGKMPYNYKFYLKVTYDDKKIEKPESVIINDNSYQLDENLLTELLTNKCHRDQDMNIEVVEVPLT